MSSFALKCCAVIFMLIDHSAIMLYDLRKIDPNTYYLMRTLGRFAFPIYCFLLAEGFRHLRHDGAKLRRHLLLLGVLAVCSEVPFDLLAHGQYEYLSSQNVIFTLLIAFGGLWLAEGAWDRPLAGLGIAGVSVCLAYFISSDYRGVGVFLVFACALYLERSGSWGYGKRLLGMLVVMVCYYAFYCWSGANFGGPGAVWRYFLAMGWYGLPHLLLVPLLASYTGTLGYRNPVLHRAYQFFYPAHLTALCLISHLLR
ncbi:MAG: hypothetical protein IKI02_02110 [Oscillospiraceae bacterium]|nr:hypothetical protein [Oscillospiraceae bacterium]